MGCKFLNSGRAFGNHRVISAGFNRMQLVSAPDIYKITGMIRILFFVLIFSAATNLSAQPDTVQRVMPGRKNSIEQQKKPYLILISVDGLRYDYIEKFNAPYLKTLTRSGVRADYMLPSYPTLTFPNHYTLVTGLYPAHHGLVSNYFYDSALVERYDMHRAEKVSNGKWYGGVPLWVLAEQQQMVTASFHWVGSEADIRGIRPTYYFRYNEAIGINRRIDIVIEWLQLPEERRPHLISFYFPEVDHAGHDFGPEAPETAAAVRFVDSSIHRLTEAVKRTGLDVSYMLVSDHGMTRVNQDEPIRVPVLDSNRFSTVVHNELMHIYAKDKADIKPVYERLRASADRYEVYLKNRTPRRMHYRQKDDRYNRIGDILLIPHWPYVLSSSSRRPNPGAHGFDPYLVQDMRASFYAWGPAFKTGKQIGGFKNIHVFPVALAILGLRSGEPIDGGQKIARKILKHH
jgi:predicted AlkP superfamily pyrophosphatase or phosphodiesterase